MFKSFLCVVLVGLFGIVSSASANFTKRNNTGLAPFGSSLQAVPQPTIDNVIDRAHAFLGVNRVEGAGNPIILDIIDIYAR